MNVDLRTGTPMNQVYQKTQTHQHLKHLQKEILQLNNNNNNPKTDNIYKRREQVSCPA